MATFVRNIEDRPKGAIEDFIYVRDNALPVDFCDRVIQRFDGDDRKEDGVVGSRETGNRVDKNVKDTKDLKISVYDDWKYEDDIFLKVLFLK